MGKDGPGGHAEGRDLTGDASATKFYGRRAGRPLRPGRARLVETLLPTLSTPDPEAGPIAPETLFPERKRAYWCEIGFGAGEHLAWQAAANPDVGLIGAEPFISGVAGCLAEIEARSLANVRLHADDGRPLLRALPEASLERVFILQPDPWRKRRHWNRRIVGADGLGLVARVLADGGEFRTSTDHPGYQAWMLKVLRADERFEWLAESADDWRSRPADWPQTRYQKKAEGEGRPVVYLRFRRRPRTA